LDWQTKGVSEVDLRLRDFGSEISFNSLFWLASVVSQGFSPLKQAMILAPVRMGNAQPVPFPRFVRLTTLPASFKKK
jgi:hypothetical protein